PSSWPWALTMESSCCASCRDLALVGTMSMANTCLLKTSSRLTLKPLTSPMSGTERAC
ncbi:hypothetical protein GGI12_002504, partial [Dipsacomyces acuminosporus]